MRLAGIVCSGLALLLCVGCAATKLTPQDRQKILADIRPREPNSAILVVYRSPGVIPACTLQLTIDGRNVAPVGSGSFVAVEVAPGPHRLEGLPDGPGCSILTLGVLQPIHSIPGEFEASAGGRAFWVMFILAPNAGPIDSLGVTGVLSSIAQRTAPIVSLELGSSSALIYGNFNYAGFFDTVNPTAGK